MAVDLRKHRLVKKERTDTPDGQIRVTSHGRVRTYISYAAKLFAEEKRKSFTIIATGNAIATAVNVAEIIKRRFHDVHQVNSLYLTDMEDTYEPKDPKSGEETITETHQVSTLEILLTTDGSSVNKKDIGYQSPLPEDQIQEYDEEVEQARREKRSNSKGGKGGKGKGKGKGKGGKGEWVWDYWVNDWVFAKGKGGKKGGKKGKGKGKGDGW